MLYIVEKLKYLWRNFRDGRLPRIVAVLLGIITVVSLLIASIERRGGNDAFGSLGAAFWWMFVTMFTVGYGDITPITPFGRALAVIIMVSGICLTAIFTAEVASYFVEKRIREGRGMEDVRFKKHVIVCGWNSRAMRIIDMIAEYGSASAPIVLVNELPEEQVASILKVAKSSNVKYIRGDYVHEGVLKRANVAEAEAVILLIDKQSADQSGRPDDRTVLAAFTIKGVNPKAMVCAEVEKQDSVAHLKRAGVETVALLGGQNDFLIANAVISPGVTLAAQELLSYGRGQLMQQREFPNSLHDKSFGEAMAHFRKGEGALLIGVVRQEDEGMGLDDILSGDMSAIDKFIKKKFEGMEGAYFTKRKQLIVNVNPPDDYVIKKNDTALIIASEGKAS